uniref:Uncharacterized protein n=1 Tax=uncultured Desulfobacterium sp. TaxID=201089 RepID=E1YE99_9BACT|nr:unknown protein [uncultured Desulfobacterium sp.]
MCSSTAKKLEWIVIFYTGEFSYNILKVILPIMKNKIL